MPSELFTLFQLHIQKTATPAQQAELQELLREPANKEAFLELIAQEMEQSDPEYAITAEQAEAVFQGIIAPVKQLPRRHIYYWIAAAAVVLIALSVWLLQPPKQTEPPVIVNVTPPDIQPGKSGALLTLQDGQKVLLDTAHNGSLLQSFAKQEGSLSIATTQLQYATLQTPNGRTMQLVLADGTKVWLNAASSIHFPTVFTGATREVSITGEAYFEVAKNAAKPFHVKHEQTDIEVLGTHFNVNAYADETQVTTTLLEGKVQIGKAILKPGQQYAGGMIKEADVEQAIAWKEGQFQFADTDVKSMMRQLARWYNIEIEYQGDISQRYFTANISRTKPLSAVVRILEASNIHCRVEGTKLIVTP